MAEGQQTATLTVLDLDIAFRPGADMERAREAARHVEKLYADQKEKTRGKQPKDNLLTFIVLGLADELLQMKGKQERQQARLAALLEKIDKFV